MLLEERDCEFLEELTIELNPDPFDEVLAFVEKANKKYKKLFRIRYSFGIQSFDDEILSHAGRNYIFNNLMNFFRELVDIKSMNAVYNLDFIAFGKSPKVLAGEESSGKVDADRLPRDQFRREFFNKLIRSQMFDGVSVYALELFP